MKILQVEISVIAEETIKDAEVVADFYKMMEEEKLTVKDMGNILSDAVKCVIADIMGKNSAIVVMAKIIEIDDTKNNANKL